MDFGLGLLGHHGSWDDARFAEEHGFRSVGFVDSQLLGGEMFACLALAAQATRSIRLGTFLAVPSNRIAAVTAQGIATINRLAPGRAFLAIGSGYTARNVMGLPALPAARVLEYARDCRDLLDGKEVRVREGDRERWIRFGQREGWYIDLEQRIPVYVAADGPKALDVTGRVADGWVTTLARGRMMSPELPALYAASLNRVRQAAEDAGRDFTDAYTMLSTTLCVLRPGETPTDPRVLARVGAYAAKLFHTATDRPKVLEALPPHLRERYEIYRRNVLDRLPVAADRRHQETHRGHLSHLLPGEAEALTDEIVRDATLTGTADEIVERLRGLEEAGLRNVTIWPPPDKVREVVLEVQELIMPRLEAARSAP